MNLSLDFKSGLGADALERAISALAVSALAIGALERRIKAVGHTPSFPNYSSEECFFPTIA